MTYPELWHRLVPVYEEREAKAIARLVYEVRYGLTLSDLLLGRDAEAPADELERIAARLERHEPVQYVLGQAGFCGRVFEVTPQVLIPRPETEELCRWVIDSHLAAAPSPCPPAGQAAREILDVGTGSGCIAVTLAAELPDTRVTACDISAEAIAVAQENARRNQVSVRFRQADILRVARQPDLLAPGLYTCMVSNPPYVCQRERASMAPNVLDYEPPAALFVPDDDPLLFYRAIAACGQAALRTGGWLYFEINPLYADHLRQMLSMMSYRDIETREDRYGKQRMIRACR